MEDKDEDEESGESDQDSESNSEDSESDSEDSFGTTGGEIDCSLQTEEALRSYDMSLCHI